MRETGLYTKTLSTGNMDCFQWLRQKIMCFTQANMPYMRIVWFTSYDYHMNRAQHNDHTFWLTYDICMIII